MDYSCFDVEIKDKIAHVRMNRPDDFNSMNKAFWSELPHLVEDLSDNASARVIVLSGEGKHFCAGDDDTFTQACTRTDGTQTHTTQVSTKPDFFSSLLHLHDTYPDTYSPFTSPIRIR